MVKNTTPNDRDFTEKNFIYFWSILSKMLDSIKQSVTSLKNRFEAEVYRINQDMDADRSNTESMINSINTKVSSIYTELKNSINSNTTSISNLRSDMNSSITSINQTIEETQAGINSIEETTNQTIANINNKITTIQSTISQPKALLPSTTDKPVDSTLAIMSDSSIGWKAPVTSINGLSGGTINGDINVNGSIKVNGKALSVAAFHVGTTAPPDTKIFWIDTTANGGLKYHNGTNWVLVPVGYN